MPITESARRKIKRPGAGASSDQQLNGEGLRELVPDVQDTVKDIQSALDQTQALYIRVRHERPIRKSCGC